jgi:hypothetical protein
MVARWSDFKLVRILNNYWIPNAAAWSVDFSI